MGLLVPTQSIEYNDPDEPVDPDDDPYYPRERYYGDVDIDTEKPNGYGTMFYKNGDIYEGKWKNGQRNGIGTLTLAKGKTGSTYHGITPGTKIEANWEQDIRVPNLKEINVGNNYGCTICRGTIGKLYKLLIYSTPSKSDDDKYKICDHLFHKDCIMFNPLKFKNKPRDSTSFYSCPNPVHQTDKFLAFGKSRRKSRKSRKSRRKSRKSRKYQV